MAQADLVVSRRGYKTSADFLRECCVYLAALATEFYGLSGIWLWSWQLLLPCLQTQKVLPTLRLQLAGNTWKKEAKRSASTAEKQLAVAAVTGANARNVSRNCIKSNNNKRAKRAGKRRRKRGEGRHCQQDPLPVWLSWHSTQKNTHTHTHRIRVLYKCCISFITHTTCVPREREGESRTWNSHMQM